MTQPVCAGCARPLAVGEPYCFACIARPERDALPERIGPYPVLRAIGAGGMGSVYAAQQHCPAREVAIKVMKEGIFADEALRAQFLREREIAGSFEHPNIIRVYDAGEDEDGQLYYVMELAQLGTLRSYVRHKPLAAREAARLMVEVAFAVDYAHQRGVLHRDLKPDNILIGEDHRARVTDFGVARVVANRAAEPAVSCESTFVGSYPYMAPEQAGYRGPLQPMAASVASDVYSLGAIMYELLHGAPPYAARDRAALLRAFAAGPPAALQGCSVDLEAVIAKALDHTPAQRYASAAAFAEDLRRSLGGRIPVARPHGLRRRLQHALAHHAAWFSILVAALSISAATVMALSQAASRARRKENEELQAQATRTATVIARIFKHAGEITRQIAHDPKSQQTLAHEPALVAQGGAWLEHDVRDNDLVHTAFLVGNDGLAAAHYPRELPSYYQLHFQGRAYFRGAKLEVKQGLGLAFFVSPLFTSRAQDSLTKLAFSSPVYDDSGQTLLGIAVATIALQRLMDEVGDPRLTLQAPREVELDPGPGANVEIVRVELDHERKLKIEPASGSARQLVVAYVAQTDYAVVASVQDPQLGALRSDLLLGIMGLVSLCVLTLFLLRRARADTADH